MKLRILTSHIAASAGKRHRLNSIASACVITLTPGLQSSAATWASSQTGNWDNVTATGWNEARKALHEVHRIAHEEVCLIPLWQITEHFAYRSNLQGVAEQPARLYQQVEQWQSKDPLPAESP